MSGSIEMDKCDFCQEIKQVERTYLQPSKYVKEQGAFINKTLYNEGDYFIIVKTCADCGTPAPSQTLKDYHIFDTNEMVSSQTEISDEEITKLANEHILYNDSKRQWVIEGMKLYREQLKIKL